MVVRVLIVDDNDYIRKRLKEIAEDNGYETETAIGEKEARAKIEKEEYNIIITDMDMEKRESGIEVIKAAKNKYSSTQVIVISGTSEDITDKCKQEGAFSFVSKKGDFQDFCEKVFLEIKEALSCHQSI